MNGFFLINYLGKPDHKGPKESGHFIAKELKFNDSQLQQFQNIETNYHTKMRTISDSTKILKDELFSSITAASVNQLTVDSLINAMSKKEILKEKELFNRLRRVYELCDQAQKERFTEIIQKARRFDNQGPKNPPNRE
jgi:Spy/CpxP family protein refolding chaperone